MSTPADNLQQHPTLNQKPDATVHLQDYGNPDGTTLCGTNGKTMSHHEIKRGRITCAACLATYTPPAKSATFNLRESTRQPAQLPKQNHT